jgi:hypothetical protein
MIPTLQQHPVCEYLSAVKPVETLSSPIKKKGNILRKNRGAVFDIRPPPRDQIAVDLSPYLIKQEQVHSYKVASTITDTMKSRPESPR